MVLYLIIIFVSMLLLVLLNWLALGYTFLGALLWVSATTGIEIGITVLLAILTGFCVPKKWYRDSKIYAVSKRELNFYHVIRVGAWKDYICELGILGGFSKRKVQEPNDLAYIDRFLLELNKGMFMHMIGIVGSFLILLVPTPGFWSIKLPVALVDAVLNGLPLMVLRYNKPRLLMLKTRLTRQRKATENENVQNSLQQESNGK